MNNKERNKNNANSVGARLEGIPVRHDTTVPKKSNKTKATPVGAAWHAAQKIKTTYGITLIALIITIIVMLILIGVVLNYVVGERGIIAKAKWSAYVTEYEKIKEEEELYTNDYLLQKIGKANRIASLEDVFIKTEQNKIEMYPVSSKVSIEEIQNSLKETIKQLENLNDSDLKNENLVNLYKVDFSKINATAKKNYVINIASGMLYSVEYEKYEGKLYHTPRTGIERNKLDVKINKVGTYEMIVDAGQTVSWDSIQIYYDKYVENSLKIKVYTSDDEIKWTEETIGTRNQENNEEKYDLSQLRRTQYLKIEIEVQAIEGNNAEVDYILVNFYKYRETGVKPEVEAEGVEKTGPTYTIPTEANGETEADGTGEVIQKVTIPTDDKEYMLDLGEGIGHPTSQIKVTNPDGTEENYTITDVEEIKNIPIAPGSTVEITTTLKPGEGIEEVKVLEKEQEKTTEEIPNITDTTNKPENKKWITVEKNKYVYNNGGTGYWEKCYVNEIEVEETGIIEKEEETDKRIKISYQISTDGKTWSQTFTNIQEAENARYLKVIVEYQTINGIEYGDTSNNKVKVILNDGSWKITFKDEDGTELFTKRAYFANSNKQGTIILPNLEKTKGEKEFVCWKIDTNVYLPENDYTATENTTFTAYYAKTNIYTVEDLCQFRDEVNSGITFEGKTVNLMNDLNLNTSEQYDFDKDGKITFKETATKCKPIGSTDKPYKGIFNGNNHTISGLYINETNEKVVGLFGMVAQNAEIKNVTINNSYMSGNHIGGIAGYNEGRIYRCNTQRLTIMGAGLFHGGIVAVNNGEIVECASTLLYGNCYCIGGIAGVNGGNDTRDGFTHNTTTGKIYRSYSTGYIKYAEAGSIASHNGVYGGEGYIYDCYSTAKMEDNMYKGSIVAVQSNAGRGGYIYNSYYLNLDCDYSSVATSQYYGKVSNSYANDTSVTAEKLNSGSSDNVWTNDIQNKDGTWKYNNGYPILKWQLEE